MPLRSRSRVCSRRLRRRLTLEQLEDCLAPAVLLGWSSTASGTRPIP